MWIPHLKYGSKDRNFCTLCLWNKNKTFKHFNPCTNSTYYRSYDDCAQNRDERIKKSTQLFTGHILISLSYLWTFAVTCLCYSSYAPGPLHMPHPWTIIPFPSCQLENAYSFFKANLQSQSLLMPSSFFPDVFWRSKQSGFCPLLYFLGSGTSGTLTSSFFKLYPICNHPVIESATLPFSRDHHLCSRLPTTTIHLASQVVSLLPPHHPTAHPQSLPKAWQWLSTELGFWPWPPGPRVVQPLHYFPAYMQLSWLTFNSWEVPCSPRPQGLCTCPLPCWDVPSNHTYSSPNNCVLFPPLAQSFSPQGCLSSPPRPAHCPLVIV